MFDTAGNELEPDRTTDWWQGQLTEQTADMLRSRYGMSIDPVEHVVDEQQARLPVPAIGRAIYAHDQPPTRAHTVVYVPVEDEAWEKQ